VDLTDHRGLVREHRGEERLELDRVFGVRDCYRGEELVPVSDVDLDGDVPGLDVRRRKDAVGYDDRVDATADNGRAVVRLLGVPGLDVDGSA